MAAAAPAPVPALPPRSAVRSRFYVLRFPEMTEGGGAPRGCQDWLQILYGLSRRGASAAVRKFDGRVMPGLGDSLMAVFRATQRRGGIDAERAACASALAIQQGIGALNAKFRQALRRLSSPPPPNRLLTLCEGGGRSRRVRRFGR